MLHDMISFHHQFQSCEHFVVYMHDVIFLNSILKFDMKLII
jgi:hypothetical protein